jgi:hypothetical protein
MLSTVLTVPAWMVQLEVELAAAEHSPPGLDELEPMVELLERTEAVRWVTLILAQNRLALTVGLSAPDSASASGRARALVTSCSRFAGLGEATLWATPVVTKLAGTG